MRLSHKYGYQAVNVSQGSMRLPTLRSSAGNIRLAALGYCVISAKLSYSMLAMNMRPTPERPLVGHQLAFLTIIGLWVFHFVIVSLRSALLDFPSESELVQRRALVSIVGVALTWLLYLILRAFDRQPLGHRVAMAFLLAVPCAFAIAYANYYLFNIYDPAGLFAEFDPALRAQELTESLGMTAWQEVSEIAITRYFFIIAWASLYLALGYAQEVREAERTAARFAQAAQDSELRSLRYQVNPHFLFNTLNSLSSMVITGKNAAAEEMIQNLSNFYRTSLSIDPLEDVSLDEEIALQQRYLEIEAVRYPERLRTEIKIEESVHDFKIPTMILQPLVENAIKYGVSRTNRPVTVSIKAQSVQGGIEISVADDGDASPVAASTHRPGAGIGLANVRDRLEARYGPAAQLQTEAFASGGFVAKITIQSEDEDGN
jgi:two-component system LytT family sensor kinase